MLKDGAEPPGGVFWELRHLAPVKDYPPRHASTMLAFDAAVEAMRKALGLAACLWAPATVIPASAEIQNPGRLGNGGGWSAPAFPLSRCTPAE